MLNVRKKLISLFLAVITILTCMCASFSAFAAPDSFDGAREGWNKVTMVKTACPNEVVYVPWKNKVDAPNVEEHCRGRIIFQRTGWMYMEDGRFLDGWQYLSSGGRKDWYHFDSDGFMLTGWYKECVSKKWYFLTEYGNMVYNCWEEINGEWYHFNASGVMQTGWLKDKGNWYYLSASGKMVSSNWVKDKGNWYYFDKNGVMLSDKKKLIKGKIYKFDANGVCLNP